MQTAGKGLPADPVSGERSAEPGQTGDERDELRLAAGAGLGEGRIGRAVERAMGIEPTTFSLGS
jgi:hypothetical protein